MCSCTHDFTCSRCAGTPFDPRYLDDEPAELTGEQFEDLLLDRNRVLPIAMLGEEG